MGILLVFDTTDERSFQSEYRKTNASGLPARCLPWTTLD
jgi:hypothetical protein